MDAPVTVLPYMFTTMDIDTYHSCPGISRSSLMAFKKAPIHYWHQYLNPLAIKAAPTEEMVFGNAVHSYILEPHEFHNRYRVYTKKERRSKLGKSYYESEKLAAAGTGRELITDEQYEQIQNIEEAIREHNIAHMLIKDAAYEHSIFWRDPETALVCKARPDIWKKEDGHTQYIADLKTTNDASLDAFKRDAYKHGYYLQAVMLREALKHLKGEDNVDVVFICVEKTEPYAIGCYQPGLDILEKTQSQYHELLWGLKQCQEAGEWPSYGNVVVELGDKYAQ